MRDEVSGEPRGPARAFQAALTACVLIAALRSYALRWTCDDAFISFRYAQNFVLGRGLVFNVGERVEGYTNFLWTVAIAPSFALGISPETWTQLLGGAAFAATVWLLGALHGAFARQLRVAPLTVPLACAAAALHREWAVFAGCGLETAAFTLTCFAGFAMLVWPTGSLKLPQRGLLAGACFGVAVLLRPDGVVFAGAVGLWLVGRAVLARGERDVFAERVRCLVLFALAFGLLAGGHLVFRLRYYGDIYPNTYYAKSGDVAWYAQGARYAWLYLIRYPLLALLPFALLWFLTRPRTATRQILREPVGLASWLAIAHVFWVIRVGGDFMFGRFLIPATPFVLFVLEATWFTQVGESRSWRSGVVVAVAAASFALLPNPIAAGLFESGIADEHAFYSAERVGVIDDRAARVKPILEGLDARVAFYSAQARFVYRANIATAIESETGLTDAFVARQVLPVRHRVGHEKNAPPEYLIDVRRAHVAAVEHVKAFDAAIPYVPAELNGVRMQVLHWDPAFVRAIRERGALVADYPTMLDGLIGELDRMSREQVAREFQRARRFYFSAVDDPARERAFVARLAQ